MKLFMCLLWLIAFNVFAATSLKQKLIPLLPKNLHHLEIGKTHIQKVLQQLGKPAQQINNKLYYETEGFKYSLELTFDQKNILTSLHYTFPKRPTFQDIQNLNIDKVSPSHGGFLKYEEDHVIITFDPDHRKLESVKFK